MNKTISLSIAIFCFWGLFQASEAQASERNILQQAPDVIINTKSLSQLPKDILKIPVLKDLLTEDFVFYYRHGGADWLNFKGTLARLAYEGESDWSTQILAWLLDSPAEVGLWRSPNGKLNQFLVVIDQTGVKSFIEMMAKAAVGDTQLKVEEFGGRKVYRLGYSEGKEVFFTSDGGRLFVYSNKSMVLPGAAQERTFMERAKSFFGASEEISVFGPRLSGADHVLTASIDFLSFGYQAFFSALKALKFEFKQNTWSTKILAGEGVNAMTESDWSQQPSGAAFCFGVPFDTHKIQELLDKTGPVAKASYSEDWLKQVSGRATACWHPDSKFYTPVIAVYGTFKKLMSKSNQLDSVFNHFIGSREAYWKIPEAPETPVTLMWSKKLPISQEKVGPITIFTREVGGRYGIYQRNLSKNKAQLASRKFFRVKLAISDNAMVFSPDDRLVDRALTTLQGKFPSMAAVLPAQGKSANVIFLPSGFAKLARQSILDSLPESEEAVFRSAVSRHLFPNLDVVAKSPPQLASMDLRDKSPGWKSIQWMVHGAR